MWRGVIYGTVGDRELIESLGWQILRSEQAGEHCCCYHVEGGPAALDKTDAYWGFLLWDLHNGHQVNINTFDRGECE